MIAVTRFSLCVVDGARDLSWLHPRRWPAALPDLKRAFIAGELRGQGVAPMLPRALPRQWLPPLPAEPQTADWMARLFDCADALHFNVGRSMLILTEASARVLAHRVNWIEQRYLPSGTLWNVVPDDRQKAAVYRFEVTLTDGSYLSPPSQCRRRAAQSGRRP